MLDDSVDFIADEYVEELLYTQSVLPGDLVTSNPTFMRGFGTYPNSDGEITASVAGKLFRINKLICVQALRAKYVGETGDVIVGRVCQVQPAQKRWKIETGASMDSILLLNSINLPSGELRRKTQEDEMMMRSYFNEGQLIVAEVQSVFHDGALSLHTRNFDTLGQGTLVIVPPCLIQRKKNHFHLLNDLGIHIIFGNNGYIWISPIDFGLQNINLTTRKTIARMRNCIELMKSGKVLINSTSCSEFFHLSMQHEVSDLLKEKVGQDVIQSFLNLAK